MQGAFGILAADEQVIVVIASNHIATDAGLAQRAGERGSQAYGFQCRMNIQGDPRRHVIEGQTGLFCLLLQLTVLGWLPATIWAVYALSQYTTDRKIHRALASRA